VWEFKNVSQIIIIYDAIDTTFQVLKAVPFRLWSCEEQHIRYIGTKVWRKFVPLF